MQCAEGQGHRRQSTQPRNAQQRQRPLAKRHRVGRPQAKQWGEIRHGWQHEHGVVCQQRVKSHHDVGATLAHDLDLVQLYLRHRAVHAPDGASRRLRLISPVVAGVQVATGGRSGTLSLHPYRNDVGQCTLQVFDSRGGFLSSKSNRTPIVSRNRNSVSVRIVRDGGSPPATRAGGVGDRAVCSTGS